MFERSPSSQCFRKLFFGIFVFLLACTENKNPNENRLDISPPYPDPEEQKKWEELQNAEPFAVVELFSSEGCSDCPAAEEVLNKLTKEAMADKSYIYPLAFHVDYWNKLGWRDVFSDSSFSNRQRKYRPVLGNEVVYTPQMIVNGKTEYVGSDEKKARHVIDSVMKIKPACYFTIHPQENSTAEGKIKVDYEVLKITPDSGGKFDYTICFALVERGLTTHVGKGENTGRTLHHENIVRAFKTIDFKEMKGSCELPALGKIPGKEHSLIVFVQNKHTMRIAGANLWNF